MLSFIPFETFLEIVIPLLTIKEFSRLIRVSKELNKLYDINMIWKKHYIHKKTKLFKQKEIKKKRKLLMDEIEFPLPWYYPCHQRNMRFSLVIINNSDIPYISKWLCGYGTKLTEKKHSAVIKPGTERIIKTYMGHIWEISSCKRHENGEVYRSIYRFISNKSDWWRNCIGTHYETQRYDKEKKQYMNKKYENPIFVVIDGDKYKPEECKGEIGENHPLKHRNFRNFKKEFMKLYSKEKKEKLKKQEMEHKISKDKLFEQKTKKRLIDENINLLNEFVNESKKEIKKTNEFFEILKNM